MFYVGLYVRDSMHVNLFSKRLPVYTADKTTIFTTYSFILFVIAIDAPLSGETATICRVFIHLNVLTLVFNTGSL